MTGTTNYKSLKKSISTETTTIQTNFNTLQPTENEKQYVKELLNKTLENQFTHINDNLISVVNSLRKSQHNLSTTADKLNFITSNSYDGYYQNTFGGLVVAQQLTSTTTTIIQSYTADSTSISNFVGEYVNPTFQRGYPSSEEYIFFSNHMYTNKSLLFTFDGNYENELKKLIRFRDNQLYNNLLKIDESGFKGIKVKTKRGFEPLLNDVIRGWIGYDLRFFNSRITNGIVAGYDILDGQISQYTNDFNVEFGVTTGQTAQNLVRDNLRQRQSGVPDNRFNFKLERQLHIS